MKETTMNTKQYTAADFANAEFARNPDGGIAARFDDDDAPWISEDENWHSDATMASYGWVPVREAAAQPITLDALQAAWEGAEVADECNEGDILILRNPDSPTALVQVGRSARPGPMTIYTRILHRSPKPKRPKGDEGLDALLDERGVRVAADWLMDHAGSDVEDCEACLVYAEGGGNGYCPVHYGFAQGVAATIAAVRQKLGELE